MRVNEIAACAATRFELRTNEIALHSSAVFKITAVFYFDKAAPPAGVLFVYIPHTRGSVASRLYPALLAAVPMGLSNSAGYARLFLQQPAYAGNISVPPAQYNRQPSRRHHLFFSEIHAYA